MRTFVWSRSWVMSIVHAQADRSIYAVLSTIIYAHLCRAEHAPGEQGRLLASKHLLYHMPLDMHTVILY